MVSNPEPAPAKPPKRSPMQSRWKDADARKAVETWAKAGVAEDLALRTYTTRLLGRDPALVLHGGGNTSLKTRMTDLAGNSLFERENAKIAPGIEKLYAGTKPATMRRYGETDDKTDEII